MSWNIFITRRIPEAGINLLTQAGFTLDIYPQDLPVPKNILIEKAQTCQALVTLLTDPVDSQVINQAANLKIIANYAVGFNNIDLKAASALKIAVTNTPGVLTAATADLTFALLFAAARRIVESDRFMRAGKFTGWAPLLFTGSDITGKTLGLIGAGRIGQAVAKRAAGFEMKILFSDKSDSDEMKKLGAQKVEPDILIRESDFISLHVPLTESTRYLIAEKELKAMKRSAVLINTSRGPVVKESALVQALQSGEIAAAGLDVFEDEPHMKPGLADLPNVVVVPHIGSATLETRANMARIVAENIIACYRGQTPPNQVNHF